MQTATLENAINRLQALPPKHQEEIVSHIDALFSKMPLQKKSNTQAKELEGNFAKFAGILTSDKHVTIEEMNDVIKRRGARLDCD